MTKFELVKYPYGTIRRYTAFCLTPAYAETKTRIINGKTLTFTNKGPSSNEANHFQRVSTAQEYLSKAGIDPKGFDWSLLEGTIPYPSKA